MLGPYRRSTLYASRMPTQPSNRRIRIDAATPDDIPLILDLIRELAEYEREPESAQATASQIHAALFGDRPAVEAVIARLDGEPVGWAVWFQTFSTWTGKPGLWLEDLFVRPQFRRSGVGKALARLPRPGVRRARLRALRVVRAGLERTGARVLSQPRRSRHGRVDHPPRHRRGAAPVGRAEYVAVALPAQSSP